LWRLNEPPLVVGLVRSALRIAAGAPNARRLGLRAAIVALLVVALLLPIQLFFAIIHTVLAAVTIGVLLAGRWAMDDDRGAPGRL